jgi:hypothetical protein
MRLRHCSAAFHNLVGSRRYFIPRSASPVAHIEESLASVALIWTSVPGRERTSASDAKQTVAVRWQALDT